MDPSPAEYIAASGILMLAVIFLIVFAVIGVIATVSEIRFRIDRRRYRETHIEGWGPKCEKTPGTT
jgi:hypothetical protein